MNRLSAHFTLDEFCCSQEAARRGIDNTPPDALLSNLKTLADQLEQVREVLCAPIIITSGYRCPRLNRLIGGSRNSDHCKGLAADFIAPSFGPPYEICERLAGAPDLQFGQLIHEFAAWVHFSTAGDRREIFTICDRAGGYRRGLHRCEPMRAIAGS